MKLRICATCVHDRFVSNRVLYYKFGLNVADVLREHGHLITYLPLEHYKRTDDIFKRMTRDPIDIEAFCGGLVKSSMFVFLWRDDVDKLYDLGKCAFAQRRLLDAVAALKARFRARCVQVKWNTSPRHALADLLVYSTSSGATIP